MTFRSKINNRAQQLFLASWSLVELPFRIKYSLSRKLSGYDFPSQSSKTLVVMFKKLINDHKFTKL
jgi:hypothetical protein